MKVKSIVNTKKLVKGAIYDVYRLKNLQTNKHNYFSPMIAVKLNDNVNFDTSIRNFVTLDDKKIPEMNWESEEYNRHLHFLQECQITSTNIKAGDYIVYQSNTHKSLITDSIYRVSEVKIEIQENRYQKWEEVDLKIEGSNKYYKPYWFRKCTVDEVRNILLSNMLDKEVKIENLGDKVRKIDKYDETERKAILSRILMFAATDTHRNNLSVVEWAVKKVANTYKLQESDFDEVLKMDFSSIINLLENKN